MSFRTKLFIAGVLLLGGVSAALAIWRGADGFDQWFLFVTLTILATTAHLLKVKGPNHEAWHLDLIFFFAGVLLLPSVYFIAMVVTAHVIEWGKERLVSSNSLRNWYIQPFNISVHIISGCVAHTIFMTLHGAGSNLASVQAFLAAICAGVTYIVINHGLVGQALVWARGMSWRESGILRFENAASDFVLLFLGYMVAVAWLLHPVLLVPALTPLILIYRGLTVPRLKHEAQLDHKTGLWNANHFRGVLETELERAYQSKRSLPIIMADMDLLREVNNTYGHLAGDAVLTDVGHIIRTTVQVYHIAARFGGEEFCIALPDTSVGEASLIAEDVRRAVESHDFIVPTTGKSIHVTISLGVANFPEDGETCSEVIHAADLALYQAKYQGRNRVETASKIPSSVTLADNEFLPTNGFAAPAVESYSPVWAHQSNVKNMQENPKRLHPDKLEPESTPEEKLPQALWGLVGIAIMTAIGISAAGFYWGGALEWRAILVIAALAFIVQLFQIPMYGESSVSASMAVAFCAALIAGIPGAFFASSAIAIAHWIRKRSVLYKSFYNWSAHLLAGSAPAIIVYGLGINLKLSNLLAIAIPMLLAALLYYIIDTGLIAAAVAVATGDSVGEVWRKQFRWLVNQYLVGAIIGLFAAVAYVEHSITLGVVMLILPVSMMYYAQKQYVNHTRNSIRELQRMNRELTQANVEIESAAGAIHELNNDLFVTMATVLDARDPYVRNHSARVAEFSTLIATRLGLPPDEIEHIYQAAMLHDIGKLGIPEQILHKPARLTNEEYSIIKEHVRIGAGLVGRSKALRHLVPAVRYHHERWDGRGYLAGLRGEEIPIASRILAVSDSVEAMAADRPYHRAMSLPAIIEELKRNAGTQFDPQIVRIFVEILEQENQQFIKEPIDEKNDWSDSIDAWWQRQESEFTPPLANFSFTVRGKTK